MTLEPRDFGAFLRAVHGDEPFAWQTALVERLAGGQGSPDIHDIPAGAGRTAALEAGVFHLALDPGAPLRAALVADRRLNVDDALALVLEARTGAHAALAPGRACHPTSRPGFAQARRSSPTGRPPPPRRRSSAARSTRWGRGLSLASTASRTGCSRCTRDRSAPPRCSSRARRTSPSPSGRPSKRSAPWGGHARRRRCTRRAFEAIGDERGRVLLVGRSRAVERERLAAMLAPFRTGAPRDAPRSLVVVATQCLEVGVEVDLDTLVTQAAPLDALRQRFGRLNRGGRAIRATGAILAAAEGVAPRANDPVYPARTRRTWEALGDLATRRVIDFGADARARTLARLPADSLDAARHPCSDRRVMDEESMT